MGHARGIVHLDKFMCEGAQVITCIQHHVLQLLIWISVNVRKMCFELGKQIVFDGHPISLSKQGCLVGFKPVLCSTIFWEGLQAEKSHEISLCHRLLASDVRLCEPYLGIAEPDLQVVLAVLPPELG